MENLIVTIPLEEYNHLKKTEFILDEVVSLVNECISSANVNKWDKKYLQLEQEDTKRLLRYINGAYYDKRLEEEQE